MSEQKAKYTPGPWEPHPPRFPSQVKAKNGTLYSDWSELMPVDKLGAGKNMEANARLIAAAPSLYKALKAVALDWHEIRHDGFLFSECGYSTCPQSRAALDMVESQE